MATLICSVSVELSTDFAVLQAVQPGHDTEPGGFAGSALGCLAALCGTKYAELTITAERWDSRPSPALGWEDLDELPFEEDPEAGPLVLGGIDLTDTALDISGLGRARVLVHARGRHRYGYSDVRDDRQPEEWLLQFFPDPDHHDALFGGPRRLRGHAPFGPPRLEGWAVALHAWRQTGWDWQLRMGLGYDAVHQALIGARQPMTSEALALRAVRIADPARAAELPALTDPLSCPLEPEPPHDEPEYARDVRALRQQSLAVLAEAAGTGRIVTMGHYLRTLQALGLLLSFTRGGRELLVPNPMPGNVWDVIDLPDRQAFQMQVGCVEFRQVADDLANALRWAPHGHLRATLHAIGLRFGYTTDEVLGGMDLLGLTRDTTHVQVSDSDDVADAVWELRAPGPR